MMRGGACENVMKVTAKYDSSTISDGIMKLVSFTRLPFPYIVTARNSSSRKLMLLQMSVILSGEAVGYTWCLVPGPMSFLGGGVGYFWFHVPRGGG